MRPVLLAPPAIEPMTLQEAKLYLRIDQADEDELVRGLLVAARLLVEAASGRQWIDQTWRLILDAWPSSGMFRLPVAPARQVTGVRVFSREGAATQLAAAVVALETGADPPALWVTQAVPQPGRFRSGLEIDVLCGFGPTQAALPEGLRQAILCLTARWYEQRGDSPEGMDASLPADVMALMRPHRRVRF